MKKLHSRLGVLMLALVLALGLAAPAMAAGKLSTPTDLQWGYDRPGTSDHSAPRPGAMSWRFGENNMGVVRLTVYRNNQKLVSEDMGFALSGEDVGTLPADYYGTLTLDEILTRYDIPLNSGTYYFTVQNITNWDSTSSNNSAVATSPAWTYTKPAAQLAAPTAPKWDFPYCTWQSERDSTQWLQTTVYFYYCKTKNGTYDLAGTDGNYNYYSPNQAAVDEYALENFGAGYYKFRVINLSRDITQWQNSAWSAYSEPYYYDGSPVEICHHWNQYWRNETWETCTEDGYTGDLVCDDCGEILEKGEVIPALGHVVDSYDGSCMRCGQRLEYYGTLGKNSQLSWTYFVETGEMAFSGVIPSGQTVYVARYQNGRLAGVKAASGSSPRVNVGTDGDELRLFWLDGSQVPQCPAGSLELLK